MSKGRRKNANRYKTKKNMKSNRQTSEMNLKVIGTIIFSILLAVLLYMNSGTIGKNLNEILGGLIGILRYILPIGTFFIAIKIAAQNDEEYIGTKLLQYTILILCMAITLSIFEISNGSIDPKSDISQNLKKAYSYGALDKGGGAVGTLAAIYLVKLLGNMGAAVLSIGISIMILAIILRNRYIRFYK